MENSINPNIDSPTQLINSSPNPSDSLSSHSQYPDPFKKLKRLALVLAIAVVIIQSTVFALEYFGKKTDEDTLPDNQISQDSKSQNLNKFKDEEEFKKYVEEAAAIMQSYGSAFMGVTNLSMDGGPVGIGAGFEGMGAIASPSLKSAEPYRVSETNVQVKGIDEPDILKTDGKNIYYSAQSYYRRTPQQTPLMFEDVSGKTIPDYPQQETKIIEAFPVENLKELGKVTETGNLLRYKNYLLVFTGDEILAYNVTSPTAPTKTWTIEMENNNAIVAARLMGDSIYLVTATRVTYFDDCVRPVIGGTRQISIMCTDIYRPDFVSASDSTYTVFKVNPESGNVENKVSFLGSSEGSVVYMSPNAVYISYLVTKGYVDIIIDFFVNETGGLIPTELTDKMKKIRDYDISLDSKFNEIGRLLENYQESLTNDEKARIENELENKLKDYMEAKSRDAVKSGVAKIELANFTVKSSALVPGMPLNQFSLDEYDGNLRIATTISDVMFGSGVSKNDVYVLDSGMNIIGRVLDLGLTERIYSVRFIADKGYIVTFRQIDPFYVLDISDPKNPVMKGELKIPGYSAYLHPIDKNNIIGVGKEGSNVKLSLFNVENAANPLEVSKYTLDEYYSEAVNNHHAFLMDPQNEIFFIPGSKGGYIFSFSGKEFALKRVVTDITAKRALYINNFLYIAGDDAIVVINLSDYSEAAKLELN